MKKHLFISLLISIISCKENISNAQEQKLEKIVAKEIVNDEIHEIGNLYLPEKMNVQQGKISTDNKKEDYQITLTNSDLLDKDTENLQKHAEKIAHLYHKNLVRNISPLNYTTIIVVIEHRNGHKDSFEFSEKDIYTISKNNF